MKSVRSKIILLVVCCIILSSAAIGCNSIINARKVASEYSTQIMNLLCANRVDQINAKLKSIEKSVETLTVYVAHELHDLARFQTDMTYVDEYTDRILDVAVNTAQNTEDALSVYVRFNPEFAYPTSGLFYSRVEGEFGFKMLTPADLSVSSEADKTRARWFYEPIKNQRGTWMTPHFNENIKLEMITYAIPFYVDKILIGVVGMDIEFTMLEKIVSDTSLYDSGYAFLTDSNAKIIYHNDLLRGTDLLNYNYGEFRNMAEIVIGGTNHSEKLIEYSYRGTNKEAAFGSLVNDMRLVVNAPTSEIDAQSNRLILQIIVTTLLVIIVAVALTILYTRRLIRPLLELTAVAKKIADGDLTVSITHQSSDEVGALAESFRQTMAHLHKYISYINELAYRDSLTGVKNKTAYMEVVDKINELMPLKRIKYAVVVFDINGLKRINDTRGHDFGDILIISAVNIICRVFQYSIICRIGGDEFAVILEGRDYDYCTSLMQQLQEELDEFNLKPENELKISVACGIAVFSKETDLTYNDVFKRADSAMYRNKIAMKAQTDAQGPQI